MSISVFFNKNKIDFNKSEISNIAWVPIEILVKETLKHLKNILLGFQRRYQLPLSL